MRGTVKIGSVDVKMLADASSPIIYRRVFHRDYLRLVNEANKSGDEADGINLYMEMGFIMAMQEIKSLEELSKLTEDDYIKWLTQFGPNDMLLACGDIANLYNEQEVSLSVPKKEDG